METCAEEIVAGIFNSKYGTAEHSKTDSSDEVEIDPEKTLSSMSARVNAAVEIQSLGAGVVPRSSAQRMDNRNTKNSKRDSTR